MRYGNVDANHADLRDNYFRKLARSVIDCSQFGMGFSDLLVLTNDGQLYMVEIKDGAKCKSKRRLTPMQKKIALEFKDKFLVATDGESAQDICIMAEFRCQYTGIKYMEETE
jgi:hypothetical protein